MSYRQGEVLGRVERRRRFSLEQCAQAGAGGGKLSILAEACAPGAVISAVARRHGLLPAQVFKWRRLAALGVIGIPGAPELPSFVLEVAADTAEGGTVPADVPAPLGSVPATLAPASLGQDRAGYSPLAQDCCLRLLAFSLVARFRWTFSRTLLPSARAVRQTGLQCLWS